MDSFKSFTSFLLSKHILDSEQTLQTYSDLFDNFEEASESQDDSQLVFETRAIFSLADFIKSLTANECYDIA